MTGAEALSYLRSELSDEELPYLWSDATLYGHLDDAQTMFCRLTDGISDSTTTAVTTLVHAIAATAVALHPSIKLIRSAYLVSTGKPVEIVNAEDMPRLGLRFDGSTGPAARLITGMDENMARYLPVPSVADSIKLSVFRLPITSITTGASTFEIGAEHHKHLSMWAKHLAYGKQDSETFDRDKSARFEGDFVRYCANAQAEQRNKRRKVRTVAYGGL